MSKHDVQSRTDLEQIVEKFYAVMLKDPIVGFIFTDVAQIDLLEHLPIIVDFWADIVLRNNTAEKRQYSGNALQKHVELSQKLSLKPGHFTRWLYLFSHAVREHHCGPNAEMMIERAELVAKSISAATSGLKKADINLVLPSN